MKCNKNYQMLLNYEDFEVEPKVDVDPKVNLIGLRLTYYRELRSLSLLESLSCSLN